jgi:glycosyltransferase involved in cell wall biosynthesis
VQCSIIIQIILLQEKIFLPQNTAYNIIFSCGREPEYPRNHLLLDSIETFFNVKKITSSNRSLPLRYASIIFRYPKLLWNKHHLCLIGFLGHPLVPIARLFTARPIIFDMFISIYDTLIYDRQSFSPGTAIAKIAFWIDQFSCAKANLILVDTQAHAEYIQDTFRIPKEKIKVLFVGCDEKIFTPANLESDPDLVLYYSSYLPLHGTEVVVRAAKILQTLSPSIHFRMIGNGLEYSRIRNLADQLNVKNIQFLPFVPLSQLPKHLSESGICLGGHFGSSEKAKRVIAGKTYQCLAMAKPTVVGENQANHELLTHGKDAWFCEMDNPQALANAIIELRQNEQLSKMLGTEARITFLAKASYQVLRLQIKETIEDLLAKEKSEN